MSRDNLWRALLSLCFTGEVTSWRKDMTSNVPFRFEVEFGARRDVDEVTMSAMVKLVKEIYESYDIGQQIFHEKAGYMVWSSGHPGACLDVARV